jgi:hypothetical protein
MATYGFVQNQSEILALNSSKLSPKRDMTNSSFILEPGNFFSKFPMMLSRWLANIFTKNISEFGERADSAINGLSKDSAFIFTSKSL